MNRSPERRAAYAVEAKAAREALAARDLDAAFARLERAHILGQPWAGAHSWTHWMMLRVAWRRRGPREVAGQLMRLAGGGVFSWLGWAPAGNTGGADVSAFRPMPYPADLEPLCRDR